MDSTQISTFGNFGDGIGGISAILGFFLSLAVLYYVIKTYHDNKDHTRKDLFRNTYFNMLTMLDSFGNIPNQNPDVEFFKDFIHTMQRMYRKEEFYTKKNNTDHKPDLNDFLNYVCGKIDVLNGINPVDTTNDFLSIPDKSKKIEDWKKTDTEELWYIEYIFTFCYDRCFETKTSRYFRYMYNVLKVAQTENKTFEERSYYINLLQAQLSPPQLAVLFYNCLSSLSENENGDNDFKDIVTEYKIINRVDDQWLLNPTHRQLFFNINNQPTMNNEKTDDDSFIRWQKAYLEESGKMINLLLTLSIATIGFVFSIIKQDDLRNCASKIFLLFGIATLLSCAAYSVFAILSRVDGFRITAKVARARATNNSDLSELRGRMNVTDKITSDNIAVTRWLFVIGESITIIGLVINYSYKFF